MNDDGFTFDIDMGSVINKIIVFVSYLTIFLAPIFIIQYILMKYTLFSNIIGDFLSAFFGDSVSPNSFILYVYLSYIAIIFISMVVGLKKPIVADGRLLIMLQNRYYRFLRHIPMLELDQSWMIEENSEHIRLRSTFDLIKLFWNRKTELIIVPFIYSSWIVLSYDINQILNFENLLDPILRDWLLILLLPILIAYLALVYLVDDAELKMVSTSSKKEELIESGEITSLSLISTSFRKILYLLFGLQFIPLIFLIINDPDQFLFFIGLFSNIVNIFMITTFSIYLSGSQKNRVNLFRMLILNDWMNKEGKHDILIGSALFSIKKSSLAW